MTVEEVSSLIAAAGVAITRKERLPNDRGTHIVTIVGQVADIYDTGTVVVHGRDAAGLSKILRIKRPNK